MEPVMPLTSLVVPVATSIEHPTILSILVMKNGSEEGPFWFFYRGQSPALPHYPRGKLQTNSSTANIAKTSS